MIAEFGIDFDNSTNGKSVKPTNLIHESIELNPTSV